MDGRNNSREETRLVLEPTLHQFVVRRAPCDVSRIGCYPRSDAFDFVWRERLLSEWHLPPSSTLGVLTGELEHEVGTIRLAGFHERETAGLRAWLATQCGQAAREVEDRKSVV